MMSACDTKVSLLTGCDDPNYAIPMAAALAEGGVRVDFIGNDAMEKSEALRTPNIHYLNLRGGQDPHAPLVSKIARICRYYLRLLSYALRTDSKLFHILWLNKLDLLDRTLLNVFYKLCRKTLIFTAHNVNGRKRDGNDTWLNRATLRLMYSMFDHIFVHTEPSRDELIRDYNVKPETVSVIPFGLNTYVPDTVLSRIEARTAFGFDESDRVLLFFGRIAPYKGLDVLIDALRILSSQGQDARLLIAGPPEVGFETYWQNVKADLERDEIRSRVVTRDNFIPDRDVAALFQAADVLVLPYRAIYQSGPLSLAHRFGVPVVATRVGAFARDVMSGVTGFLCQPENPDDLARAIREFFESDLYRNAEAAQKRIREIALERYSWESISRSIADVYARLDKRRVTVC